MFFFSCITVTLRVLLFTWRFNSIRQVATGSTTEFYFLGSTCVLAILSPNSARC